MFSPKKGEMIRPLLEDDALGANAFKKQNKKQTRLMMSEFHGTKAEMMLFVNSHGGPDFYKSLLVELRVKGVTKTPHDHTSHTHTWV